MERVNRPGISGSEFGLMRPLLPYSAQPYFSPSNGNHVSVASSLNSLPRRGEGAPVGRHALGILRIRFDQELEVLAAGCPAMTSPAMLGRPTTRNQHDRERGAAQSENDRNQSSSRGSANGRHQ